MTEKEMLECAAQIVNDLADWRDLTSNDRLSIVLNNLRYHYARKNARADAEDATSIADLRTRIDEKYEELHDKMEAADMALEYRIRKLEDAQKSQTPPSKDTCYVAPEVDIVDRISDDGVNGLYKSLLEVFGTVGRRIALRNFIRDHVLPNIESSAQKSRPTEDVLEGIPAGYWNALVARLGFTTDEWYEKTEEIKQFLREHVLKEQQ